MECGGAHGATDHKMLWWLAVSAPRGRNYITVILPCQQLFAATVEPYAAAPVDG
jgi:hypothetical protein